jgi:hypothetical protein
MSDAIGLHCFNLAFTTLMRFLTYAVAASRMMFFKQIFSSRLRSSKHLQKLNTLTSALGSALQCHWLGYPIVFVHPSLNATNVRRILHLELASVLAHLGRVNVRLTYRYTPSRGPRGLVCSTLFAAAR